jgi:magnesium chelatase family protein
VLFLDEIAEFSRGTLEVLRQPLEDGVVTISRAAGSWSFPALFSLIASMNPCLSGHFKSGQLWPLENRTTRANRFWRDV